MAVAIVIMATLSVFASILAFMVLYQPMHIIAFEQDVWDKPICNHINNTGNCIEQQAKDARTTVYNSVIILPLFLVGAIILWAYLSVVRQDYTTY